MKIGRGPVALLKGPPDPHQRPHAASTATAKSIPNYPSRITPLRLHQDVPVTVLGPDHPATLTARNNLALVQVQPHLEHKRRPWWRRRW